MDSVSSEKRKKEDAENLAARVREVLLEIMQTSESDSVRVSAAKALLDRIKPDGEDGGSKERERLEEHETLDEARALLEALAEAKLGGAEGAFSLDTESEAQPADA